LVSIFIKIKKYMSSEYWLFNNDESLNKFSKIRHCC
jgi:hypothetical protein